MKRFIVFAVLNILAFAADKNPLNLKPRVAPDADSLRIQQGVKNPPPAAPKTGLQVRSSCTDSRGIVHTQGSPGFEACSGEMQRPQNTPGVATPAYGVTVGK